MTPNETLAAARLMALEKHKYFRAAITRLVPKPLPGCGTLGVTEHAVLYWDPAVVTRWGVKLTAAVIVHEISHLLRDHPGRCKALMADHQLFNVAGDLEINDDILAAGWELPPPEFKADGVTPGTKEDILTGSNLGFGDGKLAEEYYQLLKKQMEKAQKQPQKSKNPPSKPDDEDEDDSTQGGAPGDTGDGEEGDGSEGEGEGEDSKDVEGEGEGDGGGDSADHDNEGNGEESKEQQESKGKPKGAPGKSSSNPSSGGGPGDSQGQGNDSNGQGGGAQPQKPPPSKVGHGHCGSCAGHALPFEEKEEGSKDGRSTADLARMRREVAEAVREEASKGRGTVPAGWARWAETSLKPPKIPWQQKLARFARAAVAYRAGQTDFTRSRPSRRQSAVGYGIGKPLLSAMHSPKPEVAVIADTSGSMGTEELTTALREVRGIMLACGTGVTFLSCDAEVHALKKARHWNEIPGLIKGGGGTDMRPAFAEIMRLPKKPDVVICLTDGCIGDPGPAPQGIKVIWVSLGRYRAHAPFSPWGDFLEIDELDTIEDAA